ncbi:MAG: ABC transporter permease subunit, partial [Arenimonas sp.]
MISEIFRFELRQQLRSPLLWLIATLFGLFAFLLASTDAVQIGGAIGNVNRNAPLVIVTFLGFTGLFGLLVIGIFIANALLRDFELGTADLFFSSPVRKRDFLIGRFGAALAASLIVYLVFTLGLILAPYMPWIDPEQLGPNSLAPYLWGYGVIVLPNLLFTGAFLALLAVTTRSLLSVYIGVVAFFVLNGVSASLLRDLDNVWIATLADPTGMRAFNRMVRYWSTEERNSQLPELLGYLLANRLLWTTVAITMVTTAFKFFKTERAGTGKAWFGGKLRTIATPTSTTVAGNRAVVGPRVVPTFSPKVAFAQYLRQTRFDTAGVLRGVAFLVLLVIGLANFLASAWFIQAVYGTEVYPVTSLMLGGLQGAYSVMLIFIVMFYAGELVWKERGAKLGEVTDAMPVPNWVPLAAKMTALVLVVLIFQAMGGLAAVGFQLAKGYTTLEPALYVRALLLDSVPFVLMGGLALVLQVLTNNKFVGFGLLIVVIVLQVVLGFWHFDHNLYNYANAPDAPYSDMNGYGHYLAGRLWFQGYWALCLVALLLLSAAFWVRGVAPSGSDRATLARHRLRGRAGVALAASLLGFAAVGGYIFWNSNILNSYIPGDVALDGRRRYEVEYRKYKDLPQPRITAIATDVDLHPETQQVRITGRYTIRNQHAQPIADLHIQLLPETDVRTLEFGAAKLIRDDAALGYRIYHLDAPMQPSETRVLRFDLNFAQIGFGNDTGQTQLVENGTFINSGLLPSFGYSEAAQIQDRNERRKRGLGEVPRMPKLEDETARANTYIAHDADWIDFKTTVCTAPDQVALAPGYLQKEYSRNGRRCFDYAMDRPMQKFFAYLSARWQVKKDNYQGIAIEVYYDAKHPYNVDRMVASVKKSLAYYQANFTPYQFRQVRIIEFPGYSSFAQSFANTIPYSESIGFIADLRDQEAIDYVYYITAHEVAHQWWAHQVIGANVQGSTMLSESLA